MTDIVPSNLQNKDWRKKQPWYKNGKHNECEKYQKNILDTFVILEKKPGYRLRKNTVQFVKISNLKLSQRIDKFDFTEDFDYIEKKTDKINFYYNLKMICDKGGAQTRTVSLVYEFIQVQLMYLAEKKKTIVYFINILDGDTSYNSMKYFKYLLNQEKYTDISKYIFIGDLSEYKTYVSKLKIE